MIPLALTLSIVVLVRAERMYSDGMLPPPMTDAARVVGALAAVALLASLVALQQL